MISAIIAILVKFVVAAVTAAGYFSVFFLMALESCGIPIPSEVIMPFSGFLVVKGQFAFWPVAFFGALGNLAGSWLAYWIGLKGGRPLIEKYGKYIFLSEHDLNIADRWFLRYGEWIVFFGRLLPVIRTYISFPAGISKMNFRKFSVYTFVGAFIWSTLFTWLGVKLGNNWEVIREQLHNVDVLIAVLVFLGIVGFVYKHRKHAVRASD
ncbi:MAG: DedA family protein [Patescibacteria group bacterium]